MNRNIEEQLRLQFGIFIKASIIKTYNNEPWLFQFFEQQVFEQFLNFSHRQCRNRISFRFVIFEKEFLAQRNLHFFVFLQPWLKFWIFKPRFIEEKKFLTYSLSFYSNFIISSKNINKCTKYKSQDKALFLTSIT